MDLKLTIYKEDESGAAVIDRVLTTNTAFIPHKVFKKVLGFVGADTLPDELTNSALLKIVFKIATTSMDELENIMILTFAKEGLKQEELENCNTLEMCRIVVDILTNSFREHFGGLFGE